MVMSTSQIAVPRAEKISFTYISVYINVPPSQTYVESVRLDIELLVDAYDSRRTIPLLDLRPDTYDLGMYSGPYACSSLDD